MNVFVAFFVLLLLLADNTPPAASTVPLIGELQHVGLYLVGALKMEDQVLHFHVVIFGPAFLGPAFLSVSSFLVPHF